MLPLIRFPRTDSRIGLLDLSIQAYKLKSRRFAAVVRDMARPARLRKEFDPGDRIHSNEAGNQAMADAFDLNLFKK